jgi:hypothetical protein
MNKKEETTNSYFAFGRHWDELLDYAGYVPENGNSWEMLKDAFYASDNNYGNENPLPLSIKNGNSIIGVYVYGFKIPDIPVITENPPTIQGRVALCNPMSSKVTVAIAW